MTSPKRYVFIEGDPFDGTEHAERSRNKSMPAKRHFGDRRTKVTFSPDDKINASPRRRQSAEEPARRADALRMADLGNASRGRSRCRQARASTFIAQWPEANIHAVDRAQRQAGDGAIFHGRGRTVGRQARLRDLWPETKHDLRSISKSVTSLLVGIALDEGKIPLPRPSVLDAFPTMPICAPREGAHHLPRAAHHVRVGLGHENGHGTIRATRNEG